LDPIRNKTWQCLDSETHEKRAVRLERMSSQEKTTTLLASETTLLGESF